MLTRLIESQSRFARNDTTTAASVAIHLILITVAAFFTTAKAITEQEPEQIKPLVWIRTVLPAHTTRSAQVERRSASAMTTPSIPAPAQLSLAINANIPAVNVELAGVRSNDDEFARGLTGSSSNQPAGLSGDPSQTFDAREVDTQVSALSNQPTPVYPASLRAAGVEGRVIAQFIVDSHGDAIRESIRIVSSTNDLFGESVAKAIRQMRFAPAKIGNKAVSQVVQQLFVFKLDR